MSHFTDVFLLEFKRFFSKRNLIILLIIFILMLIYIIIGMNDHKTLSQKEQKFKNTQAAYFKNTPNYEGYGRDGINLLFIPSPAGIFFRNTIIPRDLTAKIDSIVSIRIVNNLKGKSLSPGIISIPGHLGFSCIVLMVVTLLALCFGCESLQAREYLRFLSGTGHHVKIFLSVIMPRFILFAAAFLFLFGIFMVLLKIKGIQLSPDDYVGLSGYLLLTVLMLLFFFMIGVFIGTLRSKVVSVIAIFAAWFTLIFIIPGAVNLIIEKDIPDITRDYQTELDKFKVVVGFEKRAAEESGKFDRKSIAVARKIIETYWNNDYKKMEQLEENLKNEIAKAIHRYVNLSLLTPTTFYNLTANEVSSRGYGSYLELYGYLRRLKHNFVRFYIDRVYYNDPSVMVSFIKEDENLFRSRSCLPGNFPAGIAGNLGYIVILFFISCFRCKKTLYTPSPTDKKPYKKKDLEIHLKRGEINVFYAGRRPGIRDLFYNYFLGLSVSGPVKEPYLRVTIDGEEKTGDKKHRGFSYICHPGEIPGDITAGNFISYIARSNRLTAKEKKHLYQRGNIESIKRKNFSRLEDDEQVAVLLSALPYIKGEIYLLDQTCKGMPFRTLVKLKNSMETLAKTGAMVIYLSPDKEVQYEETDPGREVVDLPYWAGGVDSHKKLLEDE